jgi:hypothetical protein
VRDHGEFWVNAYGVMPNKPIEIPAGRQSLPARHTSLICRRQQYHQGRRDPRPTASALRSYQGPREKPIKLHEVKQMFVLMKDHA